ncbi:hypothetical protein NP493_150g04026 [Ridgeia piscesae]|uniref:Uncharacterized protein n=1 Tax=Ridgeia piscesae TaxID=27915 RepID=A0AAD9P4E3_RIDPI|nr:hypothetical protein NP493_150g04026 [Ridgeia piscesae]
MTTEPPPFVFKSILPHVVLAIVLVVLLVTHFVHHHFNYTLRKHHRPSAVVEDADDVDDEADPKGSKTSKMVMVVSPMKTRSDKPVASGSESVNDKALYSSRIEVMAYAAPLHRNVTEERPEDDDTSVTDTEEVITATKRHSGQNGKLSTQSVQSGWIFRPHFRFSFAVDSFVKNGLGWVRGHSPSKTGIVSVICVCYAVQGSQSVADRQTALDDAELITPVGSTNALNVFDQMPEPTSKLGRLAEVKSRLKPAPVIQINERHTVL